MEIKFKEILDHPGIVNPAQIDYLEKVTEDFPYFQIAHLLLAKKLYQAGKIPEFNNYLKKAAIYATDRKKLYYLIHNSEQVKPDYNKEAIISENIEQSKTPTAQEILNQRLAEISAKKEKQDDVSLLEKKVLTEKEDSSLQENKDIRENKKVKPAFFSIDELLELPEKPAEINTDNTKTEEPSKKDIPVSSKLSFKDWLHYYSGNKSGGNQPSSIPNEEKPKTQDLIDKFIKEEPRISPAKNNFFSPVNMARKSVIEPDDLISETLANIYYSQGNLQRALHMYEKLSLKYPEKRLYFAAQIKNIRKLINQQKQ